MANFSRVHEELNKTVSSSTTSTVTNNIAVKGYSSVSLTVRADSAHSFDATIVREGYDDGGAYGASDGGDLQGISSGGNQVATVPENSVESPEISVEITNNDTSSHDYDVFVGGQSR